MDMSLSKLHELVMAEKPGVLQSKEVWGHKEWDTTEWLNNNSNKKDKKELNSKAEGDSGTQKQIYGYQRGNGEGSVRR